jgi:tetratricopeptide (TPR) repeat protein
MPDVADLHFWLAEYLERYDRVDEAIDEYQQTIRLTPDYASARHCLARTLRKRGRTDQSIAERREAIRLEPDFPEAYLNLATQLKRRGKYSEALREYERCHELGSKRSEATGLIRRASGWSRLVGQCDSSRDPRRSCAAKPRPLTPPSTSTWLASPETNECARPRWHYGQSVPLLEDVLKRQEAKLGRHHPDTQLTVGNLGVNYKDAGRLKEAIPLLEEAYQSSRRFRRLRNLANPLIDAYGKAG